MSDAQGSGPNSANERDFYRRLLDLERRDQLEPLLEAALSLAVEITGAESGYLELHDDDLTGLPRLWRAHGLGGQELETVRASISRGIIARAIAGGETIETESAMDDDRFANFTSVRERAIRAVLCAPIGKAPPLGILYVQRRERAGGFSAVDRERIELFASRLDSLADRLLAESSNEDPDKLDHTREIRTRFPSPELVGRSAAMARVLQQAALVAPFDMNVLITGRPGTGKTALARAIARNSRRGDGPFAALNCAAVPDSLFESEMFGSERGAHSTATKKQLGKIAAADGGTLFLDEVGELSLNSQAKLLHLVQELEYHPLGAATPVKANIRIISATNADLRQRVAERQFREDLYDRLRVFTIELPDLAQRREDIGPLADQIVHDICRQHHLPTILLSRRASLACREAPWSGNVRDLAHALTKAVVLAHGDGSSVVLEHHIFPSAQRTHDDKEAPTFQEATRRFQRRFLLETLEANDWNIIETAKQIDLARSHVYKLIHSFGLARK